MLGLCTAIILGIGIGVAEACIYFSGICISAKLMLPYAAADAMLILAVTCLITALLCICRNNDCKNICTHTFCSLCKYVKTIVLSSSVFLIFTQILAGTCPCGIVKWVLAFIGSISFWVMLTSFIAFIFRIACKQKK